MGKLKETHRRAKWRHCCIGTSGNLFTEGSSTRAQGWLVIGLYCSVPLRHLFQVFTIGSPEDRLWKSNSETPRARALNETMVGKNDIKRRLPKLLSQCLKNDGRYDVIYSASRKSHTNFFIGTNSDPEWLWTTVTHHCDTLCRLLGPYE